ncbi:unnamed protein product [Ranitomeya imitator]|uniref:Helix-turn-helix domain-containing protein n=1 Tax=Ranitomeya imitator TaxID=111125 RepID=A0ABN9LSF0_9NEOB|nr:unnamed protein product [Ranitomeya imitator]
MHRRPNILQTMPIDERQTFQDLLELLEENVPSSHRKRFPYRNKSLRTPSFSLVPAIKIFFELVKRDIMAMPIREKQYLWVANPVTATFYMLPKIHKDSTRPPGRPIVSSIGSMCERASEYLDFFLQPIASSLPSFIRDSSHFIGMCDQVVLPTNFLLVTCDVESLYSNIGHKDGVEAIAYFLDKKTSMDRGHDSFLLDLMFFVLHHNFFLFDRVYYLQRSGVAMGAKCAPAYANIFLGWWEEKFVYSSPLFAAHVHAWYRFIDDVFIIWKGTEEECVMFFEKLNSNPLNIFLTFSISASDTTFLDLRVFPHEQHLATDLFRKPTATNALLEFSSFHPWHTKVGVPTGQFLHIRRNCTLDTDFTIRARELSDRFRHRGYPKRVISTAYQRAKAQDQRSLLSSKRQDMEAQTRFITDFNNNWKQDDIRWADYPRIKEAGPETYFYNTFGSIGPEEGYLQTIKTESLEILTVKRMRIAHHYEMTAFFICNEEVNGKQMESAISVTAAELQTRRYSNPKTGSQGEALPAAVYLKLVVRLLSLDFAYRL